MSVIEPRPDLFTDRFRHYHSSFEQTVSAVIEPRPDLFTVSILGEFSSGKSTLVNALFLEQDLLPIGSGVCTPVPTEIIFGDQMELKIVTPKGTQIYKNDIKSSMEYHCGKEKTNANAFYLTINNPRLEGMRIIDTPGLNAPNDIHTPLTQKIIDDKISDLVLWTIDLTHGATMSILEMLERLKNADHRCILIANHADKLGGSSNVDRAMLDLKSKAYMFPEHFKSSAKSGLKGIIDKNDVLLQKSCLPKIWDFVKKSRSEWLKNIAERNFMEQHESDKRKIKEEIHRLKEFKNKIKIEKDRVQIVFRNHITNKANDHLEEMFLSKEFKSILAKNIESVIDEIHKKFGKISPYKFMLAVKNELIPKINALIFSYVVFCMDEYASSIDLLLKGEVQQIEHYLKDMKIPINGIKNEIDPNVVAPDSFESAINNVLNMMLAFVGTIAIGISTLFVQQTVTTLIFFTTTSWDPTGITFLIISGLVVLVTGGKIKNIAKKTADEINKSLGVPDGHGIIDQMWFGGALPPRKKMGKINGIMLKGSEAGRQLHNEIENFNIGSILPNRKDIDWALWTLNEIMDSDPETLKKLADRVEVVIDSIKKQSSSSSDKIPSMKNERLHDFDLIWKGIGKDGNFVSSHGLPPGGIEGSFSKILDDMDGRIKKLKTEVISV